MYFDKFSTNRAAISFSKFEGELSNEYNLIVTPAAGDTIDNQLLSIKEALGDFMNEIGSNQDSIVFQRFFVSDFTNQSEILKNTDVFGCNCAVSIVQQSPLSGIKVALWTCILEGKNNSHFTKEKDEHKMVMAHNGYKHVYNTQMHSDRPEACSYDQTNKIFTDYLDLLKGQNLNLEEHCLRTWFYVRDIDNNYAGMVKARNQIFDNHQLTKETHFIASTGIEGRFADPSVSVLLDAYAVGGVQPEQIKFLEARDFLNPTHEYGVAFERGTSVEYGDRRHIFISGTASIDNKGEIVHVGDVDGQIGRAFENIRALLKEADSNLQDLNSMIVYLRDVGDYQVVENYLQKNYSEIPYVIVLAPVCRPGWLIEIECMAIKSIKNEAYSCF